MCILNKNLYYYSIAGKWCILDPDYITYGFTQLHSQDEGKAQCVVCYKVLANHSLQPPKLKLNLERCHPNFVEREQNYFQSLEQSPKKQKLESTGTPSGHQKTNFNIL